MRAAAFTGVGAGVGGSTSCIGSTSPGGASTRVGGRAGLTRGGV